MTAVPREARSGLEAWRTAELPAPPDPRGFGWLAAVGPGVIVLGASIGSGEFLLGPAAFVRHGVSLLWVTLVAATLQTILNMEVMRYTLATGEPVFTGFMRTRPGSTFWAWTYAFLYVLQFGWPAWAGTAAGALFFLGTGRLPGAADADTLYAGGVAAFAACVVVLTVGRRIERTLEILNWVLVIVILGGFVALGALVVPAATWTATAAGFVGYDPGAGRFAWLPSGTDLFLLGAVAAFSGAGGVANLTLSNWARDKGYGMGRVAGYIPAAFAGREVRLAHTGFTFVPTPEALGRWRGWWRIVRADQWGVYYVGALLGMALPAALYVASIPSGSDIRGLGIAAALAEALATQHGAAFGMIVAALGAWLLWKTQLDLVDGMVRAITDILWTASPRVRRVSGDDVRRVYYVVLAVVASWGVLALRLSQPVILLQLSANVAGVVLVIASLHLLYVNTTLLPEALRPPTWRRVALVLVALFYGTFAALSLASLTGWS
jgi:Mn2+/Fe2+ NRAMP family transporter